MNIVLLVPAPCGFSRVRAQMQTEKRFTTGRTRW